MWLKESAFSFSSDQIVFHFASVAISKPVIVPSFLSLAVLPSPCVGALYAIWQHTSLPAEFICITSFKSLSSVSWGLKDSCSFPHLPFWAEIRLLDTKTRFYTQSCSSSKIIAPMYFGAVILNKTSCVQFLVLLMWAEIQQKPNNKYKAIPTVSQIFACTVYIIF